MPALLAIASRLTRASSRYHQTMPRQDREDHPTVVIDPEELNRHLEEFKHIATNERPTSPLRPEDIAKAGAQWPFVFACLERIRPWASYAFRRGTIALLEIVIEDMKKEDASSDLVVQARDLVEALAHMQWGERKQEPHEQSFESTPTTRQTHRDWPAVREQESGEGLERDARGSVTPEVEAAGRQDGTSNRSNVEQGAAARRNPR